MVFEHTFNINLSIQDQLVQDQFDAVDRSTSSWVDEMDVDLQDLSHHNLVKFDREEDEEGSFKGSKRITHQAIAKGLTLMAKGNPEQFALLQSERGDALTADVFLQFVIFGKEVYA